MTGLPVGVGAHVIVLVDATSSTERQLIDAALAAGDRPATVVPLNGAALPDALDGADPDTVVTAVRVAWAPARAVDLDSGKRRRGRWSTAVPSFPRRPRARCRRGRAPRRRPGPRGGRRARHRRRAARPPWDRSGTLADFVARQAALALERAERALVGDRYKVPRSSSRRSRPARSSAARSPSWPRGWSCPRPRSHAASAPTCTGWSRR